MNSLWSSRGAMDAQDAAAAKAGPDVADIGVTASSTQAGNAQGGEAASLFASSSACPLPGPSRPPLVRNQLSQPPPAVPPPPSHPPPVPGAPGPQQPPDSLSLAQLRRIVADFPRSEPLAYDFVYEDYGPAEDEIDEWFVYQYWQWARLSAVQRAFEWQWDKDFSSENGSRGWDDVEPEARSAFVREALESFSAADAKERSNGVGRIVYIVLGRWGDTAGGSTAAEGRSSNPKSAATDKQLAAMKAGVELVADVGGLETIWGALRFAFDPFWGDDPLMQPSTLQEAQDELMNLMTIMYIIIQQVLSFPNELSSIHDKLLDLNPSLVGFMLSATARMRWDETGLIPQAQVFLLFWKSILLAFGGTKEITETKKAVCESGNDDKEKNVITASPLDYHTFRQEITSKYPAYIPPQTALPLEADNNSLLPPLPNQSSRGSGFGGILPAPPNAHAGGASILHQPVHIATPAPSPPPSPGVGGKGGKKQNYQTNQNFPLMYPPLDATSNSAGGKGNAGLQDLLVGRRWEGSDIPASILEAGELFSRRVRMTRATRQLWEERERFLRFSRGWDEEKDEDLIDELDLSSLSLSEREELGLLEKDQDEDKVESQQPADNPPEREVDYGPNPTDVPDRVKRRLAGLEQFYKESLPQLQSLVIVLLKAVLFHVTVLMTQPSPGQQQHAGAAAPQNGSRAPNGVSGPARGSEATNGMKGAPGAEGSSASQEEVDNTRTREITAKAVSGILLLMLKWLKLSHILKFEYLSQLLLDSNYLPLVLKLFAHLDVQQTVDSKSDRVESSFFYFCNLRAGAAPAKPPSPTDAQQVEDQEEESEDEACPPPIKRQRSPLPTPAQAGQEGGEATSASGSSDPAAQPQQPQQQQQQPQQPQQPGNNPSGGPVRPEVDELGYPVNPLPKEPITDFSRRNFFSLINFLRVMQKVCKGKAHRNLLLVQYKSSNILRKSLRVPQEELRLYTLKLFKNQVPYCGRKWRQGNMRVITAVYLHCRPELRDEWLAGSDVDAEVEEALPLEQALRSLTHWFNVRRYPDCMGSESAAALREEHDFFVRELERADLGWAGDGGGDEGGPMGEWDGMPA